MEILFYWAGTSIVLIFTLLSTESFIVPKLKSTSKFKMWWRRHIIGDYDESA